MITIEEIIISSLYHRLVLVRIKRTSSVTTNADQEENTTPEASGTVDRRRGLGYLYLGPNRSDSLSELPSPKNVFVDTISLEKIPTRLLEPTIKLREEEVFLTSQIGRIIEVGELHLTTRKARSSTEVQTDFEPVWCFKKSGSPLKNFGSRESLISLDNCDEISLVRLESLENPEQRSLVVVNSSAELKSKKSEDESEEETSTRLRCEEAAADGCAKIFNTKLAKSRSSSEDACSTSVPEKLESLSSKFCNNNNLGDGLIGSYKIFNVTSEGKAVLVSEETSKGNLEHSECDDEKDESGFELGGIGDVLKPISFVKFVINRVDTEGYGSEGGPASDIPADSIGTAFNYADMKFTESMSRSSESCSPKIKPMGSYFKDRRRSFQKRSRSLKRFHGGVVDGERLLKHIMSCGGAHESRSKFDRTGFKSAQDIITITDFKVSPLRTFRGLNASQVDLRNQTPDEFSAEAESFFPSASERRSRSERSSPLMMRFTEDESFNSFPSDKSDSKHSASISLGIPNDSLWNAKCDFPASATSNSFPDDSSLSTLDSSAGAATSLEFEKFPDWMKHLPTKLKCVPLTQLCIPGSHISLAIDRDMKTSMDFSKCNYEMAEFLRKLPNLPVFNSFRQQMKHIWKAWMPKQFLSVYNQLVAGSRYLDMRITKNAGVLYGEHGLYTGQLKRYLKEVRLFLEEQHHEVVILHLQLSDFVETSDKKHLVTLLFQIFGTKMTCWDKEIRGEKMKANLPSIERLLRTGKQLIVFMPAEDVHAHARSHIFGGSVWPDSMINIFTPKKQSLEELKIFLDDCYFSLVRARSPSCVNVLRAVLSPDMSMVFGRYDKRRSMKELSFLDTSPLISEWISSDGGKKHLNIVALDFVGAGGLVGSLLQLNREGEN